MMVNDFDDEFTLEEEERLAAKEMVDPNAELNDLQREGEMSIEELMKLYGAPAGPTPSTSGTTRKRRRRPSPKPTSDKKVDKENLTLEESSAASSQPAPAAVEDAGEESPDEDGATTTTTTNNLENQSLDDETNFDEDEQPSELNKLYSDYDKEAKDGELKLDQSLSDEEDLDYSPDEDESKKTIMVGSDYQAVIPEGLCKYDDALPYENEDKLLWDPSKLSDSDIEDYMNKFAKLASANGGTNYTSQGGKHLRDDEQALYLLLQCGNNCEEGLRRRRLGGVQPAATMSIWSEEECRNFENGLRLYGKCFHEIQASKVKTRSVGECVQFYYLWKKTDRHDVFANKARLEKKKYNLNPCVTDFMDKYLEEYENNGGTNRDRSASPNVNNSNSLLLADSKHRIRSDPAANNSEKSSSDNVDVKIEWSSLAGSMTSHVGGEKAFNWCRTHKDDKTKI